MGIIKPNDGRQDTGLYRSPVSSPLKIYSYQALFGALSDLYESTYRVYIYINSDYDASKRTGNNLEDLEIPNSFSGTYVKRYSDVNFENSDFIEVELEANRIYKIAYTLFQVRYSNTGQVVSQSLYPDITYTIAVTTNKYPLKKWTITDVINRSCDTLEAQKHGEKPRFRLDGVTYDQNGERVNSYEENSLAEKYDKILSPEFSFTKMNMREMLKQVGGFIHAEPRIKNYELVKNNGVFERVNYVISYDEYGRKEFSHIRNEEYFSTGSKTDINEFCTGLDSSADNLISQLNYAQGVVIEPVNGGVITLRTETSTVRIEETDSTIIKTSLPIYMLGKEKNVSIKCKEQTYDITPYIFEKSDYDRLSSFDGVYPYSKSFALYYEQGQPNIKGLWFREPNAVNPYLSKYAIVNIIRAVTGDDSWDINGNIQNIAFRVTYLPVFATRVKTNKQYVIGGIPRQLAYNQSANMIESRYFGENLKGVVSRLGNPERTYTYHLTFLSEIPKVGMKFDDNYYISAVTSEITPSYIKCTIAVTTFNRISQYIGINSNKRMWEVSEKMSQERSSIRTEYIVVSKGNGESNSETASFTKENIGNFVTNRIYNDTDFKENENENEEDYKPISNCAIKGYAKKKAEASEDDEYTKAFDYEVNLPVVATAIGNSMLFVAKAEDNYSAGQKVGKEMNGTNVKGYWGDYVPYGDYYGRAYFYDVGFANTFQNLDNANTPLDLPIGNISPSKLIDILKWRYRKDSREVCQFAYELQFVTDDKDIIIGSALAENCCLVNYAPKDLRAFALPYKLTQLDKKIDLTGARDLNIIYENYGLGLSQIISSEYESVAIVTAPGVKFLDVEDEDGVKTTQRIQEGGELIIGANIKNGNTGIDFAFCLKTDIYK